MEMTFGRSHLAQKFPEEGGEHGPHAVIVGPDQASLYVIVGNQTALVDHQKTRPTPVWGEDLLLPRIYGNGFMRGTLAREAGLPKPIPKSHVKSSQLAFVMNTTPHSIGMGNYSPTMPIWNGM